MDDSSGIGERAPGIVSTAVRLMQTLELCQVSGHIPRALIAGQGGVITRYLHVITV